MNIFKPLSADTIAAIEAARLGTTVVNAVVSHTLTKVSERAVGEQIASTLLHAAPLDQSGERAADAAAGERLTGSGNPHAFVALLKSVRHVEPVGIRDLLLRETAKRNT